MPTYPAKAVYNAFSSKNEIQGVMALGNTVTVYAIDDILNTQQLLQIAEVYPQETSTFIQQVNEQWLIRWFSAGKEIKRCGIGTLAAVKYIQDHHAQDNCMEINFYSAYHFTFTVFP